MSVCTSLFDVMDSCASGVLYSFVDIISCCVLMAASKRCRQNVISNNENITLLIERFRHLRIKDFEHLRDQHLQMYSIKVGETSALNFRENRSKMLWLCLNTLCENNLECSRILGDLMASSEIEEWLQITIKMCYLRDFEKSLKSIVSKIRKLDGHKFKLLARELLQICERINSKRCLEMLRSF